MAEESLHVLAPSFNSVLLPMKMPRLIAKRTTDQMVPIIRLVDFRSWICPPIHLGRNSVVRFRDQRSRGFAQSSSWPVGLFWGCLAAGMPLPVQVPSHFATALV